MNFFDDTHTRQELANIKQTWIKGQRITKANPQHYGQISHRLINQARSRGLSGDAQTACCIPETCLMYAELLHEQRGPSAQATAAAVRISSVAATPPPLERAFTLHPRVSPGSAHAAFPP
eukprot:6209050-Pleurochrysis_carterae.AAC.1